MKGSGHEIMEWKPEMMYLLNLTEQLSRGSAVPVWAAGDCCFYLPREDFMHWFICVTLLHF